jgi:glyoxylase-like metal-dependent hydrolase (beta-lactamase superfamily II)
MFVGDAYQSVATAFLDGDDVLLVDALGSTDDALALRRVLCDELGKTVRFIAATHCMSDHIAGWSLFPDALVVVQRHHRHTFLSQNRRVSSFYREPTLVFDSAMTLRWGMHTLHFIHNPGKTPDHVSVDVPSADLVCVGDNIVGNIAYLSRADPEMLRMAIERVRRLGRGTVIGGHVGRFPDVVLDNAMQYLDRLQHSVVDIQRRVRPDAIAACVAAITIEACLAPGQQASDFEREWHGHNLDAIVSQSIFSLDAALAEREACA